MPATRIAIYARVSTTDKGQDTENQLLELRTWAKAQGCDQPREYIEQETATGKRARPIFERMLSEADRGTFRVVVVWALDRLSREGTLKTLLVIDRLQRAGVRVKSLREPWLDPDSPTYELLLPIFAWIANQEAKRISERVRAGLVTARAKGKTLGRRRVEVDRAKLASSYEALKSYKAVAREAGLSEGTVRRALLGAPQTPTDDQPLTH